MKDVTKACPKFLPGAFFFSSHDVDQRESTLHVHTATVAVFVASSVQYADTKKRFQFFSYLSSIFHILSDIIYGISSNGSHSFVCLKKYIYVYGECLDENFNFAN